MWGSRRCYTSRLPIVRTPPRRSTCAEGAVHPPLIFAGGLMSVTGSDERQPGDDPEARHRARMQRRKAVVDARIAAATERRGVLLVLTGNGKGKSSSAFGMVARGGGLGSRRRHAARTGVCAGRAR